VVGSTHVRLAKYTSTRTCRRSGRVVLRVRTRIRRAQHRWSYCRRTARARSFPTPAAARTPPTPQVLTWPGPSVRRHRPPEYTASCVESPKTARTRTARIGFDWMGTIPVECSLPCAGYRARFRHIARRRFGRQSAQKFSDGRPSDTRFFSRNV